MVMSSNAEVFAARRDPVSTDADARGQWSAAPRTKPDSHRIAQVPTNQLLP
jgi:hypothetical protein